MKNVMKDAKKLNFRRYKHIFILFFLAGIIFFSGFTTGVMFFYTKLAGRLEVEKAIVVDGENFQNATYILNINFGTLYQGENISSTIKIYNRAGNDIPIEVKCTSVKLIYHSGYARTKDPFNASKEWGISIFVIPNGRIVIPANSFVYVDILLEISANATLANSSHNTYAYYEITIYVALAS